MELSRLVEPHPYIPVKRVPLRTIFPTPDEFFRHFLHHRPYLFLLSVRLPIYPMVHVMFYVFHSLFVHVITLGQACLSSPNYISHFPWYVFRLFSLSPFNF